MNPSGSLDFMVHTRLYFSHIVSAEILLGHRYPLTLLAITQVTK